MTRMTYRGLGFSLACTALLYAPQALAQDASAEVELDIGGEEAPPDDGTTSVQVAAQVDAAPPDAAPPVAQTSVAAPVESDGVRFRGAIAASGGVEFGSYAGGSLEVGMGGIEGRVGVQINNLIGIYVQPSLSFGVGRIGAANDAFTGTAGVSALIDFTIADHFFVGAGGGVGILNNPFGPEIHFRVGGYPVVVTGEDGYSRQGLMLGVDARMFFLSDALGDLIVGQIMGSIGYEVF